jgi:hypothetical protein
VETPLLPRTSSAWRARYLVAALALLSWLPALSGEFLDLDDARFVRQNPAVHRLSLDQAARYFTDPQTLASEGWRGTYRPLRTLDFAIDWALGGGSPLFFHLRNVLYHVLGSLLVLALLSRLFDGAGSRPALWGALVFAVHPVQAECVAWITSRGDLLVLCLFLSALLLHISGRRLAAALVLLVAVFAKESAVVFPVAVLLVDLFRGRRAPFVWYGVYGGIAGAYTLLWIQLMGGGELSSLGQHTPVWWGGSYGANLLTMSRGLLYYLRVLLLPADLVFDYHVPATTGLDLGAALGTASLLLLVVGAVLGGGRPRLALAFALITILPTGNLIFPVGIPTADRFLYLPMVGVALWAGPVLASRRLRWVVLFCLVVLTVWRARDFASDSALFGRAQRGARTPRTLLFVAKTALDRAYEAEKRGDRAAMEEEAVVASRAADDLLALYRDRLGMTPGSLGAQVLVKKANALNLVGRHEAALAAARESLTFGEGAFAHYNAAVALQNLGRPMEAAEQLTQAIRAGYAEGDLRPVLAGILNEQARHRLAAGRVDDAVELYRRSWAAYPEPARNREARDALRRLLR